MGGEHSTHQPTHTPDQVATTTHTSTHARHYSHSHSSSTSINSNSMSVDMDRPHMMMMDQVNEEDDNSDHSSHSPHSTSSQASSSSNHAEDGMLSSSAPNKSLFHINTGSHQGSFKPTSLGNIPSSPVSPMIYDSAGSFQHHLMLNLPKHGNQAAAANQMMDDKAENLNVTMEPIDEHTSSSSQVTLADTTAQCLSQAVDATHLTVPADPSSKPASSSSGAAAATTPLPADQPLMSPFPELHLPPHQQAVPPFQLPVTGLDGEQQVVTGLDDTQPPAAGTTLTAANSLSTTSTAMPTSPAPDTPVEMDSKEAKAAREEKRKARAEAKRLKGVVESVFLCSECMMLPDNHDEWTYHDSHSPPKRPPARAVQGPGSEFCCLGSALLNGLPSDFPLELVPLIHSYVMNTPTRSFLTTPVNPSAGTYQAYILKTPQRFELYLEVKNPPEFQKLRTSLQEKRAKREAGEECESDIDDEEEELMKKKQQFQRKLSERGTTATSSSSSTARPRSSSAPDFSRAHSLPAHSQVDASSNLPAASSLHRARLNALARLMQEHTENIILEGQDIFLLSAQRKRSWTGNHYQICSDKESTRTDSPHFIAKLKSNFGGTEFTVVDNGSKAPTKKYMESERIMSDPQAVAAAMKPLPPSATVTTSQSLPSATIYAAATQAPHVRHELACILYDHFFEHSGSPIRIKVLLPNKRFTAEEELNAGGSIIKQWRQEVEKMERIKAEQAKLEEAKQQEQARATPSLSASAMEIDASSTNSATSTNSQSTGSLHNSAGSVAPAMATDPPAPASPNNSIDMYENLRPVWHDGMNAYVLHFDAHRVREKSVKNFKLVRTDAETGQQKTVLQFGRVLDRNTFVMDFAYPLSPVQAFAICLSSIDPKLAV